MKLGIMAAIFSFLTMSFSATAAELTISHFNENKEVRQQIVSQLQNQLSISVDPQTIELSATENPEKILAAGMSRLAQAGVGSIKSDESFSTNWYQLSFSTMSVSYYVPVRYSCDLTVSLTENGERFFVQVYRCSVDMHAAWIQEK